ncbi:MAG: hypothetical protein PF505_09350 [Vallitaleaceae bacterium]|jgi:hypothetical protein|nr:hypothetical protein [Vallitaleaceae bacterium]
MDYQTRVLDLYNLTVIQQPLTGTVQLYYEGQRLNKKLFSNVHQLIISEAKHINIKSRMSLDYVLRLYVMDNEYKVNERLPSYAYLISLLTVPLIFIGNILGLFIAAFCSNIILWIFRSEAKWYITVTAGLIIAGLAWIVLYILQVYITINIL